MRSLPLALALLLLACGQTPGPLALSPDATLGPPTVRASPPAGPFNGEITVTFETDRPATVYVSTSGQDPRTSSVGRLSGPSPFTLTLSATTTVKYFASVNGKDGALAEGTWFRAGGPAGTLSGVVVVGPFVAGQAVGVFRNAELQRLGTPTGAAELPFRFEGLSTGTHRLTAIADRTGDGQLVPLLDYESAALTVELDLADPLKAGPEGLRLYLGASSSGLGTLRGVVHLPKPPSFQNLQLSVLDPGSLTGGVDPAALLQQLQGGYRLFTNQRDTDYPYVITDLPPGRVLPVASLLGFGNGGIALNLLANPLRTVTIAADQESEADFAFGPVTLAGTATLGPTSAPQGALAYGVVAARIATAADGLQAVLMPVLFAPDGATGGAQGSFSGAALRANSAVALRVFTNAAGANPLTDALQWVMNPFGGLPPHATVSTTASDLVVDVTLP